MPSCRSYVQLFRQRVSEWRNISPTFGSSFYFTHMKCCYFFYHWLDLQCCYCFSCSIRNQSVSVAVDWFTQVGLINVASLAAMFWNELWMTDGTSDACFICFLQAVTMSFGQFNTHPRACLLIQDAVMSSYLENKLTCPPERSHPNISTQFLTCECI